MKCPKCGAEYKDGFTTCSDCGVELVEQSPSERQRPTYWKVLLVILVLCALIPCAMWLSYTDAQQLSIRQRALIRIGSAEAVTFADRETEEYVRRALRIPKGTAEHPVPITDRDLEQLTRLRVSADEFPLVRHCPNLTSLTSGKGAIGNHNPFSDLTPLSGLTSLVHLDLYSYSEDLTPLSSLTSLERLELRLYSESVDVAPLSTLTNLTSLSLQRDHSNTPPEDLDSSWLVGLHQLEHLNLPNSGLTDISSLVNLMHLKSLDLSNNPLNDNAERHIATLESRGVHVRHRMWGGVARDYVRAGKDISSFAAKGITLLRLAADESSIVSNLSTIGRMVNVTSLSMRVSSDCDFRPLGSLTNLTALWINQSEIQDLTPLAQLPALAQLGLVGTEVSDIESLSSLTNLAALAVDCANIKDVQHLASPNKLTHLEIVCSSVGSPHATDLRPFASLNSLTHLELRCTALDDVSPLSRLPALTSLHIVHSQVTDVSPLRSLTHLQDLRIWPSQIRDISPLAGCEELRSLWLVLSTIRDLAPLSGLKQLRFLILHNNQIEDISALAQLPKLGHDLGHDPDAEVHFIDGQRVPICLGFSNNRISDISPVVDVADLGTSHGIDLRGNPLNEEAYSTHIPALQARGVQVYFDPPRPTQ